MSKGFIIIPRLLFDTRLWRQRRELSPVEAYLDLVRRARFDPKPETVCVNGLKVECKRGELCVTARQIATEWGWASARVKRFFKIFEELGLATFKTHPNSYSVVTILSPVEQRSEPLSEPLNEPPKAMTVSIEQAASEPLNEPLSEPPHIYKERKEDNKEVASIEATKKKPRRRTTAVPFTPPTEEQVSRYCHEKGITTIDPGHFIDYYTARGWRIKTQPMRDWQATLRNWARRDRSWQQQRMQPTLFNQQQNTNNNQQKNILPYEQTQNSFRPAQAVTEKQAANLSAIALFEARRSEPVKEMDGEEPLF